MVRLSRFLIRITLPLVIAAILGGIGYWLFHNPVRSFTLSVPGMDQRGKSIATSVEMVTVGEHFTLFKTMADHSETYWPGFRGKDRDNICKENIPLKSRWERVGEGILWTLTLGEGHAAPAVFDGRVYLLDYDEQEKADALRCLSLRTGEELWRRLYKVRLKRNHGLSRTIPAVSDRYVVSIGPRCHVMCVDRISGDLKWTLDMEKEYGTEVPFWYTGKCPLIDGEAAILAPAGRSLMIAVDCNTGKKIWETPNPHGWKMSHSSVMPMLLNGKKIYVYAAIGGVCGISAGGADQVQILWEISSFSPQVVAPSPLILDRGRVFLTAGYGAGAALIQIREETGKYQAEVLQQYKPQEGLASEQQTPVFFKGHIFAILPKDAGGLKNQFACCPAGDGTHLVMTSGKTERFGLGPYVLADGKFFILHDDGTLSVVKASSSDFQLLGRTRILDGQDAWGPMAITGGYLLIRDIRHLVCIDIREKGGNL